MNTRSFSSFSSIAILTSAILFGCEAYPVQDYKCDGNVLARNCYLQSSASYLGIRLGMPRRDAYRGLCAWRYKVLDVFTDEERPNACDLGMDRTTVQDWQVETNNSLCWLDSHESVLVEFRGDRVASLRRHCSAVPII